MYINVLTFLKRNEDIVQWGVKAYDDIGDLVGADSLQQEMCLLSLNDTAGEEGDRAVEAARTLPRMRRNGDRGTGMRKCAASDMVITTTTTVTAI